MAYVSALRGDAARYGAAMDALEDVLRPLSFGLAPALSLVDPFRLQPLADAVTDILSWLADSEKADLKTAALALMGVLGWESFLARLGRSLRAEATWERAAAVDALARMGTRDARALLLGVGEDPDPGVRAAIRRALRSGEGPTGDRE